MISSLNIYTENTSLTIEHLAVSDPVKLMTSFINKIENLSKEKGFSYEIQFSTANEDRQCFTIELKLLGVYPIESLKSDIEKFGAIL